MGVPLAGQQLQAPLVAALEAYLARGYYAGHFPAHKGGRGWPAFWRELAGERIGLLDLTELPGLDDLHNPSGPVAAAQELMAELCGAARSYFLVNGASVGLTAALAGLCQPGDAVLLPRQGHRSLVTAAILAGIQPVFLSGEFDTAWGLPLGVDREELERALARCPRARALVVVYPTYEGVACELQDLVTAAHRQGLTVVVDAAHGAHFGFHHRFPAPALSLGADVVVDGWHKTLGSLTQTAVLHVGSGMENADRIGLALDLLQSTSPSYPLLASLDALRAELARRGESLWQEALVAADQVREWLGRRQAFAVWQTGPEWRWRQDPLRLVVAAPGGGLNGQQLALALRDRGGLAVEAWGERHVLLVFSLADNLRAGERVTAAFAAVAREAVLDRGADKEKAGDTPWLWPPLPAVAMTPREAFFAGRRLLPLSLAVGRVAAELITPYPPGIPLCWPGEVISKEVAAVAGELQRRGYHLQGLSARGEVAVVAA
jgi:arginine/lysine/ornithine decarboxylase